MNPWHIIVRNVLACPYNVTRSLSDRKAPRKLLERDEADIVKTYLRLTIENVQHPSKKTAQATGWTETTVSRVLRKNGLAPRPPQR